jgi:hypothetical protein
LAAILVESRDHRTQWSRCWSTWALPCFFSSPDPKSYCYHWSSVRPLTFLILINSSEATGPIVLVILSKTISKSITSLAVLLSWPLNILMVCTKIKWQHHANGIFFQKDNNIWCWKSRSWFGTGTQIYVLNSQVKFTMISAS